MPSVRFPAVMKFYVNNQSELSVSAATVQGLIDQVVEQYPTIKFHLLDAEGQLRRHFNIFVNGVHIRDLNGMETLLTDEDKVILMASAAGGIVPCHCEEGARPDEAIPRYRGDCFGQKCTALAMTSIDY